MTAPHRVQLSRAKGWRMPPNTVKVSRGQGAAGEWGNPFRIETATDTKTGAVEYWVSTSAYAWTGLTKEAAQQRAVDAFRHWVMQSKQLNFRDRARLALRGKNLACWCASGAPCHADVLLELANSDAEAA